MDIFDRCYRGTSSYWELEVGVWAAQAEAELLILRSIRSVACKQRGWRGKSMLAAME
jgi:hypothetical protein